MNITVMTILLSGVDIMTKKYIAYGIIAIIGTITLGLFFGLFLGISRQMKYSKTKLPDLAPKDIVVEVDSEKSVFYIEREETKKLKKGGKRKRQGGKRVNKRASRKGKSDKASGDGVVVDSDSDMVDSTGEAHSAPLPIPKVEDMQKDSHPSLSMYNPVKEVKLPNVKLPQQEKLVELDDTGYAGNRRASKSNEENVG